jgi:biotin operon repressor
MNATTSLAFDPHQFAGKRPYYSTIYTRLTFNDYHTMHTEKRSVFRCAEFIPPFAANLKNLQLVIRQRAWNCVGQQGTVPESVTRKTLDKMVQAFFERIRAKLQTYSPGHASKMRKILAAIDHCGGWLAFQGALCYWSWRLRWDSPRIAEELGMTSGAVREQIWRSLETARDLGLDIGPLNHWTRKPRTRRVVRTVDITRVLEMHKQGVSISQIARTLERSRRAISNVLKQTQRI